MTAESLPATRTAPKLRADVPEPDAGADAWLPRLARPGIVAIAAVFALVGGANLDLGVAEARVGLAAGDPLGPFGRALGYWDPSTWPLPVALSRAWAWCEEAGPTAGAVRWPAAICGVFIGLVLARRARKRAGAIAGLAVAAAWFGSVALIDRSAGLGLDLIAGLGTVLALDRLIARGSGWAAGGWAALAFLAGGWPPVAVVVLATIVLGRSGASWSWRMTVPVALAAAGWSAWALEAAPPAAWASALTLPITLGSAWGMAAGALAVGCPWAPFAGLIASKRVRDALPAGAASPALSWLQVAGASLIVGTIVPGLATAALAPALAGLAFASGCAWAAAWSSPGLLPRWARRALLGGALAIAGAWLIGVLAWGGYIGFAIAYYRSTMIASGVLAAVAFAVALRGAIGSDARRSLVALEIVAAGLKLAHWGYYAPEWNYRAAAGPWGRAIGQYVPDKHPVYTLHAWPLDLAFAIGRPVRQLESPQHLEYAPGQGSKFLLLQDSEYAESLYWDGQGTWPKLIKVAEFEDEVGLSKRILARTDAPLIIDRPFRKPTASE